MTDENISTHDAEMDETEIVETDLPESESFSAKCDLWERRTSEFLSALHEETRYNPAQISLELPEVMAIFQSSDSIGLSYRANRGFPLGTRGIVFMDAPLMTEILLEYEPKDFLELVRVISLCRGKNIWNIKIKQLIKDEKIRTSELISCREDCYELFLRHGIAQDEAEHFTKCIRKGKGLTPELRNRLLNDGIASWLVDIFQDVHYLPSRTNSIIEAQYAWRIAYYKLYHPTAFYKTFFSFYASDDDMEIIRQGWGGIINGIWNLDETSRHERIYDLRKRKHLELALEMIARGIDLV